MKIAPAFLASALFLAGCSSTSVRTAPKADLSSYQHVFVEHRLADGNGVDQIIARELRKMGYDAVAGPLTMIPDNSQIVVTYMDRWTFDFTTYMIELDMSVRTTRNDTVIAVGSYKDPSITGHSPVVMVDTMLKKFFKAKPL